MIIRGENMIVCILLRLTNILAYYDKRETESKQKEHSSDAEHRSRKEHSRESPNKSASSK